MHELGPFETRYATNGMVCSVDHVASSAGVAILRAGGTAADAAVGTSAVLAVTAPHMCGLGGDLFALVHESTGPPVALNASGRAGSGADPERMRADGHRRMPRRGDIRSVPVPGCVDGWLALHDRFGRLPLVDVLEPARRLAADGFAVSPLLSLATVLVEGVAGGTDLLAPRRPDAGEIRRRPGTARALADIARSGRAGFYEGAFGDGLVGLGDGEHCADDLCTPSADWVAPISVRVWGHDVWTVPPNSQGYLALTSAAIVAGLDPPTDPDEPEWAHLLVESAKQASFDRNARLHEHADASALLDPAELSSRRAAIDRSRAAILAAPTEDGGTIFLCAADASGMGVSLIQSNAADFGAHLVEPNTGTFLHNRGIGFSLVPGHPAEYGPRRRPPSTLSPTLVTDPGGSLRALVGTMGGDSQPQVVLQLLARLLSAGQRPGTAVSAPRFVLANHGQSIGFDTWDDPTALGVDVEGGVPDAWLTTLAERGHRVRVRRRFDTGMGHAHVIDVGGGSFAGMSDPRAGAGAASGW